MDNIFGNVNSIRLLVEDFSEIVSKIEEVGDIIEFGTCTGDSTVIIASMNPIRTLYTIDHFKGLEETQKPIWQNAGWYKGAFAIGDPKCPWIPKTKEEVFKRFELHQNIIMIENDIHKLESPEEYGIINNIVACNIDVDIYEPTISSLNFLDKCKWSEIYIRFDDWHGHEPLFDHHERLAFKEWIDSNKYRYNITHGGLAGGVIVSRIK